MVLLEKPDRERGFNKGRIIRVILNHPDGELTKYKLAQLSGASEPWTRQYTDKLEKEGLIQDTEVLKVDKLYQKWQQIKITPNQLNISLQQPMQLLENTELKYALTTYQAENLHQGFLFPSTTDLYIHPGEIEEWLTTIENKAMLGGGNTRLRVLDKQVFYNTQERDEFSTVSIPQLILDLRDEGGPCSEAADKLINSFHG
jgi:hypothetical protein